MSVNVIASLFVSRTVPIDPTKFSELWGDVGGNCSGVSKLLVVAIDRSDYQGASAELLNVYGIDPAYTNKFVFQAVISPDALSTFLKCVVDCDAHPTCHRWVAASGRVSNVTPLVVIIPVGDPPTTEPKSLALTAYADAAASNETILASELAAAVAELSAMTARAAPGPKGNGAKAKDAADATAETRAPGAAKAAAVLKTAAAAKAAAAAARAAAAAMAGARAAEAAAAEAEMAVNVAAALCGPRDAPGSRPRSSENPTTNGHPDLRDDR
jgi:hypothetical protein